MVGLREVGLKPVLDTSESVIFGCVVIRPKWLDEWVPDLGVLFENWVGMSIG